VTIEPELGFEVVACGLFISSGRGEHPDRVLDSYELIVVRKGTLSLWEDDVRFDVRPGQALVLFPGRRHRAAAPFARDLSFYWIHFVPHGPPGRAASIELPQLMQVQRPDCVAEFFHRYLEDRQAEQLDPLSASLLLLLILREVGRTPSKAPPSRGAALAGRAEAHVTRYLADKLSTARIARALRVNPDYLNRVFRSLHQVTLTGYIQRRRAADAATMLRDTNGTVAEIASACGYASVGHFRRVFQRHHGVSPSGYRRLMARAFVNAR
jgi:AraC-like DNA-binding protein